MKVLLVLCGLFSLSIPTWAGLIVIDENGSGVINGSNILGSLVNDPGPGGLPSILTYRLPFPGIPGDVLLNDSGLVLDVVRFNGNGTVLFYSDNLNGVDAIADTPGPPTQPYTNRVTIDEIGPEGRNSATYTPNPGQPGYDPSGPTYSFVSDGAIPEPSTILLLATGIGFLAFRHFRARS